MKTKSCWPETVGGSLVPVTDGSRRHEPSFFRPSPSRARAEPRNLSSLNEGSSSARLAHELSSSRAFFEPSPSRARVAWLITSPIHKCIDNTKKFQCLHVGAELYLANKLTEKKYLDNTIIKIQKCIDSTKI